MKSEIPKNISFGRKPNRNWIVDLTSKAINGEIYDIHRFKKLPPQIENIITLLLSFYYAKNMPKRELYIVGAPSTILALKIKRKIFKHKFIVIHFVKNDFYNRNNHKMLKRKFLDWLAKEVNGAIVPGEMIKNEIKEKFNFPIEISYHFTKDKKIFNLKPNINSKNIISIGIQPKLRKGTDIFINIAKNYKSKNKNNKFYLLGDTNLLSKKYQKEIKNCENIITPGFISYNEMLNFIQKSKYFILPGRYDAGPIVLTEIMAAGLIPIVSNKLGGQDLVKKIRKDLVINNLNYKNYIKKIEELEKLPISKLNEMSNKARKIAKKNNLENGQKDFKEKIIKLITKIQE